MPPDSRFVPLEVKPDTTPIMIKHFTSSLSKFLSVVTLLLTLSFSGLAQSLPEDAAAIKAGEALFKANCKSCHKVVGASVGPGLAGVYDRAPSLEWITSWVKNPQKMIASGDEYANKIYLEHNKSQMTAFTGTLDDAQILSIIAYVKSAEAPLPPDGPNNPLNPVPTQETSSGYLDIILIGMIIILILLVVILGFLVSSLKRFLDAKNLSDEDKEVVHSPITAATITRSRGFIFIVTFLVAALGFKAVINGLYSVGIQQGYAPKQPIAFSHKLHAGDYEIDCKYCHTGVMKGKSATIPSVNICMNCHRQVKTESLQIQKIWAAADWNAETLTFGPNQKPIEWVRIHNLPDLAYFNHSQHVNVGNIACQTCHGPIETMEVVKQYSLLTMGWCIDCHRKTDVNTKGNAYYDNLVELHKSSGKTMKVEDIGGLECSKCHY